MKRLSLLAAAVAMVAATSSHAQIPTGTYLRSCTQVRVAGNMLDATCTATSGKSVESSLNLPCNGSIDNIDGKVTCTGAPARDVPPGSYLQTCGDARVQGGILHANCRRANQTVAQASLKLPCRGKIENLNGVLTCVP